MLLLYQPALYAMAERYGLRPGRMVGSVLPSAQIRSRDCLDSLVVMNFRIDFYVSVPERF